MSEVQIVELDGDTVSPSVPLLRVSIERPHGDPPVYWIEHEECVLMCLPFEKFPELAEHLPNGMKTWHRAQFTEQGFILDFTPLTEDHDLWKGLE